MRHLEGTRVRQRVSLHGVRHEESLDVLLKLPHEATVEYDSDEVEEVLPVEEGPAGVQALSVQVHHRVAERTVLVLALQIEVTSTYLLASLVCQRHVVH